MQKINGKGQGETLQTAVDATRVELLTTVTWLGLDDLQSTNADLNHEGRDLCDTGSTPLRQASQPASRWLYLVDCVRPVLGLQAEAGVLGIDRSTLAPQSAIQEVAGVELDAGLGGVYFQDAPTSSMAHPGDKDKPRLSGGGNRTWPSTHIWTKILEASQRRRVGFEDPQKQLLG